MPQIVLHDVCVTFPEKRHKKEAKPLNHLNATFSDGSFSAILGRSGEGKTTLLRVIAGLTSYEGEVTFDGVNALDLPIQERNIAYVSQEFALYPALSVFDNMAFPLKTIGCSREEILSRVKKMADSLGLSFLLTRKPRYLSLGQQQRVAIGRALIKNPDLCLFDEPFSHLEPTERRREGLMLYSLLHAAGVTSLYVTHSSEEAISLADNVYILEKGNMMFHGSKEDFASSTNPNVMAYKGDLQW